MLQCVHINQIQLLNPSGEPSSLASAVIGIEHDDDLTSLLLQPLDPVFQIGQNLVPWFWALMPF